MRRLGLLLVPFLASLLIRLTRLTMRLDRVGRRVVDDLRAAARPYIHTFWHGHLFLMPYSYLGKRIAIMISAHHDGEMIARTMRLFGHESLRGSTTSGGAMALRAAVRSLREGSDVGFTPDGPRGPRHRAQMGVVQAARMSGAPIVPVAFAASRGKVLGSWDGFIVPRPFSKGVFVYGEPIEVPARADEAQMEALRLEVERALNELTSRAQALATGADASARAVESGHV
ncbi:MAG TPA: lysophospholipid acyltransferase family protein [Candidatus Polarisedimenticolia bacterium]|jgi:hypothetical protein